MIRTAISMQMEKLKGQPPPIPIPHSHTLHSLFSERLHQDRILSSSGKGPTSCLGHSHTNTSTNQGLQSAQYQIKSHQNTRLAIFFYIYHVSKNNSARQLNVLRCALDTWMWMRDTGFISSPNRKSRGRLTLNVCTFLRSPLFQRPILGNTGPHPCPHS